MFIVSRVEIELVHLFQSFKLFVEFVMMVFLRTMKLLLFGEKELIDII